MRLAQAAMTQRDTSVFDLCEELGVERVTSFRYVGPKGELGDYGKRVLGRA
ncbi:hypothetical protein J2W42_000724 [Rhizobium tibeticum]|nr:hypothetical protein [Rhizobium tibeticum]